MPVNSIERNYIINLNLYLFYNLSNTNLNLFMPLFQLKNDKLCYNNNNNNNYYKYLIS